MAIQQNWNIRKRAKECYHTERDFVEDEIFYTAIFEDENGIMRHFSQEDLSCHE